MTRHPNLLLLHGTGDGNADGLIPLGHMIQRVSIEGYKEIDLKRHLDSRFTKEN